MRNILIKHSLMCNNDSVSVDLGIDHSGSDVNKTFTKTKTSIFFQDQDFLVKTKTKTFSFKTKTKTTRTTEQVTISWSQNE